MSAERRGDVGEGNGRPGGHVKSRQPVNVQRYEEDFLTKEGKRIGPNHWKVLG
ncbi:hypothetical protein L917_20761 [Phytophthora nicotianae]|uniref:Uncharacterized protein n=2 Tax=Phytophthora nicotianae TaxID=4792 RepID=W2QSQ6_PHYN3|nr:hypothetical protein PPTG_21878 [Phytophthora nicotianae INRA-310]ETL78439.1 hypothetical protein L917_20761 [Phytophthora nicotianae]ETN16143.1 hypothetical protein PPTG_21878 [Phytophthora nicotianae INRA-310]